MYFGAGSGDSILNKYSYKAGCPKRAPALFVEQSTWRGFIEPSASHGSSLNEVLSSLVKLAEQST